jgi:NADPH:quinone reductase-like Zn-dependent oxidoreductase
VYVTTIFEQNKKSYLKLQVSCHFNISDEVLAAFPITGFTSYSMIRKVMKPNAKVLVTASRSNTSLGVINALKNLPIEVYAMTSNEKYIDNFKSIGVKDVLIANHGLEDYCDDKKFKQNYNELYMRMKIKDYKYGG